MSMISLYNSYQANRYQPRASLGRRKGVEDGLNIRGLGGVRLSGGLRIPSMTTLYNAYCRFRTPTSEEAKKYLESRAEE